MRYSEFFSSASKVLNFYYTWSIYLNYALLNIEAGESERKGPELQEDSLFSAIT